jgi:integrase
MTTITSLLDTVDLDWVVRGCKAKRALRRRAARVRAAFGERDAATLTATDVRAYAAARLAAGDSPGTVNGDLGVLSRALTLGVDEGALTRRPVVSKLPTAARQGFLSRAQSDAILAVLAPHARPVVQVLRATGWRSSTVLSLQWSDVTAEGLRVPGVRVKNGQALLFPWTRDLRAAIEAAAAFAPERQGALFQRAGQPIRCIRKAWRSACRRAGVPGALKHDFRRSAARDLARAGLPAEVIMRLVGWKSRAMLDRYNIVTQAELTGAAEKIDALANS